MKTINTYLPEMISFYYVAKFEGFTAAGLQLNVSKSQLSKEVTRLEKMIEAELLHRTTRKVSLTNEGKLLFQYVEKIAETSLEAMEVVKESANDEIGAIRITAPSSLGDWFASPILSLMNKKYPNVKVSIDLSNDRKNIVEENYDFALRGMHEKDPNLVARPIGKLRDVICVRPGLLSSSQVSKINANPIELSNITCILNSHQVKWNNWLFVKDSNELEVEVYGNYSCSSYTTAKVLCLDGFGVGRIPYYLVQKEINDKSLISLCPNYTITTHPIYLVYPVKNFRTAIQKKFRDLFLKWLKDQEVFIKTNS